MLWETVTNNLLPILIITSMVVEIVPIKFNPISTLVQILFKPIRDEMDELKTHFNASMEDSKSEYMVEINLIKKSIEDLEKGREVNADKIEKMFEFAEMSRIPTLKWEIIEFSNSLDNGQFHKRDEYKRILEDVETYAELLKKYDKKDGLIHDEVENITKHYEDNKHTNAQYF